MTKPTPPRTASALKLHITQAEWEQLYKNGLIQAKVKGTAKELDPFPVVKLFYPAGSGTWLLSEIEPDELEIAWALCGALHNPHYVEHWIMLMRRARSRSFYATVAGSLYIIKQPERLPAWQAGDRIRP